MNPPTIDDKFLIVKTGPWTASQLTVVTRFLDMLAESLNSTVAEDMAARLRILLLGKVPFIGSCEDCRDVKARYPVLCSPCGGKFGPMTPQRMIFKLSEGDNIVWAVCAFSTVFIPKVWGKDNTIAACEELLDSLDTEESVDGMVTLLNEGPPTSESGYKQ